MTRRRWMLFLGFVVAAICGFAFVQAVRAQPAPCLKDYPCYENPSCDNDDYCLGPCVCHEETSRCVPG